MSNLSPELLTNESPNISYEPHERNLSTVEHTSHSPKNQVLCGPVDEDDDDYEKLDRPFAPTATNHTIYSVPRLSFPEYDVINNRADNTADNVAVYDTPSFEKPAYINTTGLNTPLNI